MSEKSDWEQGYDQAQRRFYEERKVLTARIAELEALVERLIEAGEKMQALIGWSTGDEATKDWDALVKDWKKEAR